MDQPSIGQEPTPEIRQPLDNVLRSDRLRVVINALHAKSGGGVTHLRNIVPFLADDPRLELHIFLSSDQLDIFHPIDERVIVHAFDIKPGFIPLIVWEQVALPVLVKVMSADLVFSPANFGSLAIRDQVILLRNAVAVARTETRWSKQVYWLVLSMITLLSLIRVRRAMAVSNYAAKALSMGLYRFFKAKTRVVYHGVNAALGPDANVERETFLLAVSDIYIQKNLDTLLHALKRVRARHPEIVLKIAGQKIDQWYYDKVVALAEELGIAGNLEFLGRVAQPELLSLYRRCRALIFPSTAETFGMPLVEAMACGAPIASSNSTAMPEIVGDAAVMFDPLNVEEMADSIIRLIEDADLRRQLSARGLARAGDFSWRRTAETTADVLVEACPRRLRGA